jgi:hypothetical protein
MATMLFSRNKSVFLFTIWLLLSACGDEKNPVPNSEDPADGESVQNLKGGEGVDGPTWQNGISSIFSSNCAVSGCHVSGFAMGDWTSYNAVKKKQDVITKRLREGTMPPAGKKAPSKDELAAIFSWFEKQAPLSSNSAATPEGEGEVLEENEEQVTDNSGTSGALMTEIANLQSDLRSMAREIKSLGEPCDSEDAGEEEQITFDDHIQPLFARLCSPCHNQDAKNDFWSSWDNLQTMSSKMSAPKKYKDLLYATVVTRNNEGPFKEMPLTGGMLQEERDLVQRWNDDFGMQKSSSTEPSTSGRCEEIKSLKKEIEELKGKLAQTPEPPATPTPSQESAAVSSGT